RMIPQATLCWPQRQMMLHPVTGEDTSRAVITTNRKRYRHGPFGIFYPIPLRLRDLEVVGHKIKLLAGHSECRMVVNVHAAKIMKEAVLATRFSGARLGTATLRWKPICISPLAVTPLDFGRGRHARHQ